MTSTSSSNNLSAWEQFIGPGATTGENVLMISVGVLSTIGAIIYQTIILKDQTIAQIILGAFLAFDIFGGAVSNATLTTKRWYHRPGQTVYHHLGFTMIHVIHMIAVAFVFDKGNHRIVWLVYAVILFVSATTIVFTPLRLKNPVAVTWFMIVFILWMIYPAPSRAATPGMEWMIPMLFLKLLSGHLVPASPIGDVPYETIGEVQD